MRTVQILQLPLQVMKSFFVILVCFILVCTRFLYFSNLFAQILYTYSSYHRYNNKSKLYQAVGKLHCLSVCAGLHSCIMYFHHKLFSLTAPVLTGSKVTNPVLPYVKRDNDNFISRFTPHDWQPITTPFLSYCPVSILSVPFYPWDCCVGEPLTSVL